LPDAEVNVFVDLPVTYEERVDDVNVDVDGTLPICIWLGTEL
jgi:hypothetical protein